MNHWFHPEASAEFEEAVRYYRDRGRTLGGRFCAEVRTAIRRILADPKRFRVIEQDVRRCPVRVFHYGVIYSIEPDFILIIAVAHDRRQPGYWKHRLASRPRG